MATWGEFEAAAPELAAKGRALLYQYGPPLELGDVDAADADAPGARRIEGAHEVETSSRRESNVVRCPGSASPRRRRSARCR